MRMLQRSKVWSPKTATRSTSTRTGRPQLGLNSLKQNPFLLGIQGHRPACVCPSIHPSIHSMSNYLPIQPSPNPPIHPSILPPSLSVCVLIYLSIHIYLSVHLCNFWMQYQILN